MNTEKIKETVKMTLLILGIFLGAAIAVQLVITFMWACHYAGIPM